MVTTATLPQAPKTTSHLPSLGGCGQATTACAPQRGAATAKGEASQVQEVTITLRAYALTMCGPRKQYGHVHEYTVVCSLVSYAPQISSVLLGYDKKKKEFGLKGPAYTHARINTVVWR